MLTKRIVGVYGNKPSLPYSFPLAFPENAGNMIHARAPLQMLPDNAVEFFTGDWRLLADGSFAEFVNKRCDGLIVTMANTIRTNDEDGSLYSRFQRMLEQYTVPLTVFGLGSRSATEDLDQISLTPEAVELLQYLEDRAAPIGVRGEFTAKLLRLKAGVEDVVITGCPSFYSEPDAFQRLQRQLRNPEPGVTTFSGTQFKRHEELTWLVNIAKSDGYLIEPVSRFHHRAHLTAIKGKPFAVPPHLRKVPASEVSSAQLVELFKNRYRLFHNPDDWIDFNKKVVAFGFGTRFHVNMATLLAGKPALWVTHDSRTRELVDFLNLPSVSLAELEGQTLKDLPNLAAYDSMFERLEDRFDNWANYMEAHDLPYRRPDLKLS